MVVLIIYIIFAIINMVVGLILNYIDYNNGKAITLGAICSILILAIFSFLEQYGL